MHGMLKRLPLIPTLLVLIAVAVMVRLGFWQLDRADQKEAMLARYAALQQGAQVVDWSGDPQAGEELLFRKVSVTCAQSHPGEPVAGHNSAVETGWAQVERCTTTAGHTINLVIGWSRKPQPFESGTAAEQVRSRLPGGAVTGYIGRDRGDTVRLSVDPPLSGLAASARPNPNDLPNNHWSYAIQWFLFAAVALVIYGLALRKRLAAKDAAG
jgi:surfeit locus 1 family protein